MRFSLIVLPTAVAILLSLGTAALAQDTRMYTDDAGNMVEIPADPARIITLNNQTLTAPLFELGVPIIGSEGGIVASRNGGEPFMRSLDEMFGLKFGEASGITYVGDEVAPDFEVIASLQPDLIITNEYQIDIYDQLSLLAPTVVVNFEQPMLDIYRKIADIAGETGQFEERLALYREQVARARSVLENTIGDLSEVTIAVAEPTLDEGLWISRDLSAVSQVAADLGLGMPELYTSMPDSWTQLSAEQVQQIDADFMVGSYTTFFEGDMPADKRAAFEALLPGYEDFLHAARHDQYFLVDREQIRPVMFGVLETTLSVMVTNIGTRDFVPFDEGE